MTTMTISLESLAQSIARQQGELDDLCVELEARQSHLADLKSQREQLEGQLRQMDAEIQVVSQGKVPALAAAKAAPAKAAAAPSPTPPPKKMPPERANAKPPKKMADLIVDVMSETKGPVTAKPLADELQRRGFFRSSPKLFRIVQARINDLKHQGILRRAEDGSGVVLGKASATKAGGAKNPPKKDLAPNSSGQVRSNGKMLLRPLLEEFLAKSQRPMKPKELAEMALARGYATESKNLGNVVGVLLTRMENVKNVPGEGYRLKKR
jgi:hypothetical protein